MDCTIEATLGKRISARRKALGMTQDQLAAELSISAQAVSKWENDQSCPDISILPALAKRLGMTTDELLGVTWDTKQEENEETESENTEKSTGEENETHEAASCRSEETPETTFYTADIPVNKWNRFRSKDVLLALWIVSIGLILLTGFLLDRDVSLWTAIWTSGILYIGIALLTGRHHIFLGAVTTVGGAYLIAERLAFLTFGLNWQIVLSVLIVLLGISILFSRKKKRIQRAYRVHGNDYQVENGVFDFTGSFGEEYYSIVTPLLKRGHVAASFGKFTVDLSKVEAVAPNCKIRFDASFGEAKLLVPKKYRVVLDGHKNFGEMHFSGTPDAEPAGSIYVQFTMNFGEAVIKYI